jgi:hypothetical protein
MESIVDSLLFRLSHPERPLVERVVYSISEDAILNPEVRFLDPAMGGGQFLRGILDRAVALGVSREDMLPRLFGIERSIVYVNHAKWKLGLGGANLKVSSCYDPEVFGVKFDVIVGNPPYQNPDKTKKTANGRSANGTPLWAKFVEKTSSLLADGGYLALIIPAAVATPGGRGMKKARELSLKTIDFGIESFFNVKTNIALVSWVKSSETVLLKVNGVSYPSGLPIANVSNDGELQRLKQIWSGSSNWKYMDNRSHTKRADRENILVVRRMYSRNTFAWHWGLDLTKFDKESVIGLEGVSESEAQKWGRFFDSEDGVFLRRVTNYAGNISAEFLRPIDLG